MGKGTVLFPDLGEHCKNEDCKQLDFLPFTCDGCLKVFCLEHRTYRAHSCPKSEHNSRIVLVCETCAMSIEKKAYDEDEKVILERHERSGECDATKKQKPKCPVRRCKEALTFSNTSICKTCNLKVCLKHRFPSDHECSKRAVRHHHNHPLVLAAARKGMDCRGTERKMPSSPPSVKAF